MAAQKIQYIEVPLDEVLKSFTKNFRSETPMKVECLNIFIDQTAATVIYKLASTPEEAQELTPPTPPTQSNEAV